MEKEKYRGSQKHIDYMNEYRKSNYDSIQFFTEKGGRDRLNEYAKSHGFKSKNEFINLAIEEYIQSHK